MRRRARGPQRIICRNPRRPRDQENDMNDRRFPEPERVSIGLFPTPLHRLDRLSEQTGYDVWIKRDDFTGRNLYGGNKVRKLEFLMGYALANGYDYVITYGATQSNHCMQTITAARICGLEPIVYLTSIVEPDPKDMRANLLLDSIYGAEVHIIPEGSDPHEYSAPRIAELEAAGHKVYDVPVGGSNEVGICGYVNGYLEILEQMKAMGKHMDYLFTTTGSGGTLAGLAAGKKFADDDAVITGFEVGLKDETYKARVAKLANSALDHMGASDVRVTPDDFETDDAYVGEGYEIPSAAGTAAIRRLARSEGILTDPVYSGKALSGMLDYLDRKKLPEGSTIVFLHTGGTTALFAEHAIVGPVGEEA